MKVHLPGLPVFVLLVGTFFIPANAVCQWSVNIDVPRAERIRIKNLAREHARQIFGVDIQDFQISARGSRIVAQSPFLILYYQEGSSVPRSGFNETKRSGPGPERTDIAGLKAKAIKLGKTLGLDASGFKCRVDDRSKDSELSNDHRAVSFTFTQVISGIDTNGDANYLSVQLDSLNSDILRFSVVANAKVVGIESISSKHISAAKQLLKESKLDFKSLKPSWSDIRKIPGAKKNPGYDNRKVKLYLLAITEKEYIYIDPESNQIAGRMENFAIRRLTGPSK